MKLEHQVCSLELAERIDELTVPNQPEAHFYWCNEYGSWCLVTKGMAENHLEHCYAAYSVAELGEMLPKEFKHAKRIWFLNINWNRDGRCNVAYANEEVGALLDESVAENEADARAKCLIYLLENKLV